MWLLACLCLCQCVSLPLSVYRSVCLPRTHFLSMYARFAHSNFCCCLSVYRSICLFLLFFSFTHPFLSFSLFNLSIRFPLSLSHILFSLSSPLSLLSYPPSLPPFLFSSPPLFLPSSLSLSNIQLFTRLPPPLLQRLN